MSTSEEMGQALNSTSLNASAPALVAVCEKREEENFVWNVWLENQTSKLNFLIRDKISFVGTQAKVTPVAHGADPVRRRFIAVLEINFTQIQIEGLFWGWQ